MSGLDKQIVPVLLNKGQNVKTNNKVGAPGELVELHNATFQTTSRLTKRNGYTALSGKTISGATANPTGAAIATRGDELLVNTGSYLNSYDTANSAWINKGPTQAATVKTQPGLQHQYDVAGYDCVQAGGLICHVAELWSPGISTAPGVVGAIYGIAYSVVDAATGNVVLGQQTVLGASPKVVATTNYFVIFYINASFRLACLRIALSDPLTPIGPTQITTGATSVRIGYAYDALAVGTNIYLTTSNGADSGFACCWFTAETSPTSFTGLTTYSIGAPTPAGKAVAIFPVSGGTQIAVVGVDASGGARMRVYTLGLTPVSAWTVVDATVGITAISGVDVGTAASSAVVLYTSLLMASTPPYALGYVRRTLLDASFLPSSASVVHRGATLAGKAFAYNGVPYIPLAFWPGFDGTYRWTNSPQSLWLIAGGGVFPAKAYAGTFFGSYINYSSTVGTQVQMLPQTTALPDGTSWLFPAAYATSIQQQGAPNSEYFHLHCASSAITVQFNDATNAYQRTQLAQSLQWNGGIVQSYDGAGLCEQGFLYSPWGLTGVGGGVGGLLTGTYQYVACYEWTDGNGLVHRSAPSAVYMVDLVGQSVTITIPTLRLSEKNYRGGVRITLYRTTSLGSVFYQINNSGGANDALYNDPSVDSVTYFDDLQDGAILNRTQLYTTGNVVPNDPPPPMGAMCVHRNRIIGNDTTNPLSTWYSKQVQAGAPVEFSAFFTLNEDPRGGPVTAYGSLDDKLIVFKADRIFMHTGQGPDSAGGQNDWSDSIMVSSDTGCVSPRSVVVTPMGLMFQGQKGIYLLSRGLDCQYIGAPVESVGTQPITSAVLMADCNQIRFTQTAQTLVFDYFVGQWSTFTTPSADACVWTGGARHVDGQTYYTDGAQGVVTSPVYAGGSLVYVRVTSSGVVIKEVPGSNADAGAFVSMGFTTGWISLAGLQGFKRIRKILFDGAAQTPVGVSIRIYQNLQEVQQAQNVAFVVAGGDWQERIFMLAQKCEAIQIVFSDSQVGLADAYLDLSAITLEVAAKRGAYRLPSAQSTG